jgi:hypothetical protein
MIPQHVVTGPAASLPAPVAAAFVVALAVLAAGAPLGMWTPRLARRTRKAPPVTPVAATEDEQRSPDYCWTHGCHRSQCPGPH